MYVFKSNEDAASDFITGTCQLIPKSLAISSDHIHDLARAGDAVPITFKIVCGSLAEFYIHPLNTCIGDIDSLLCSTDQLAFIGDTPVLPRDLSGLADTIDCYEIQSYPGIPGFVRLLIFGKLQYNWKDKEYKLIRHIKPNRYLNMDKQRALNTFVDPKPHGISERRNFLPTIAPGPAIKFIPNNSDSSVYVTGSDAVHCLFCPQWPRDAKMWPLRRRNNGWPTSETISEVVRYGCHVVYSQHRACRDDIYQWRLSFSVAEVILLHSWTKTQQIAYHLLRFFSKRELIGLQKDWPRDDEVLCMYHLKTLMLWTCEEMPAEWWESCPVIAICCELLSILWNWLKRRHYPNYFIPEANLFHQPSTSAILHQIERRINDFRNYGILSRWFVENYILPITRTKFQFLNPRNVTPDFMDYLSPLLEYRKAAMSHSVERVIAYKFFESNEFCRGDIKLKSSGLRMNLKLQLSELNFHLKIQKLMTYLPPTENVLSFKYYDFLLYNLRFAYCLSKARVSWDCILFVEYVNTILFQPKIIRSQYHNFPKTSKEQSSRYHFMQAQNVMENFTGLNISSEFQLLSLMSKEFLSRTFEAAGYESNGVTTAALVYLAALHFASSEYQQTVHLCSAVLTDQTPQVQKETLNAGCLLFIDDVARIVGLCVLHKKITDINFHCIGRRLYLDLRLSPEVFAHYLTAISPERKSTHLGFGGDFTDSSYHLDNNVIALIKSKCIGAMKSGTPRRDAKQIVYGRINSLAETEATATNPSNVTETIIDLLVEIALENMTAFYSLIHKDLGMQCNIVDCYRALYFYKCLQYDEVLQLCERILNEPDLRNDLKEFSFANVSVIPPLDSFFDRDVQSLLGFHTLFHYLRSLNDDIPKCYITNDSSFERYFVHVSKNKMTGLYGCLLGRYFVKYHYLLGRHFLARYLKVRCCVDSSLPYKEAITEFSAQKINLPFELIIHRYFLRRHNFSIAK